MNQPDQKPVGAPGITLRLAHERGHADHGWLQAHHTFSFADYRDPLWDQFSDLRVLNHDLVHPGQGFGTHGHRNMEIVTYVLRGRLRHQDSMGHASIIQAGDVQLMSAGSGLTHSEFNASEDQELELLQMWVLPRERETEPHYEEKRFREDGQPEGLLLVASADGRDGSLTIGQDARLFAGLLAAGATQTLGLGGRRAWLHVGRGSVRLEGHTLKAGDGAGIEGAQLVLIEAQEDSDLVLFDLA